MQFKRPKISGAEQRMIRNRGVKKIYVSKYGDLTLGEIAKALQKLRQEVRIWHAQKDYQLDRDYHAWLTTYQALQNFGELVSEMEREETDDLWIKVEMHNGCWRLAREVYVQLLVEFQKRGLAETTVVKTLSEVYIIKPTDGKAQVTIRKELKFRNVNSKLITPCLYDLEVFSV